MPDKDQFTFDDDDGFPESDLDGQNESSELDLSSAFSESEYVSETSSENDSEPQMKSSGGSRMRILLIILLLVVAGAGGAYYFMDLGGTTPSVPTVLVPAQTTSKSVALPPQPAKPPAKAEPVTKPVAVAVPPPAVEKTAAAAPVKQTAVDEKAQTAPVAKPTEKAAVTKATPEPVKQPATQSVGTASKPTPAPQPKAATTNAVLPSVPVAKKVAVAVPPASKLAEPPEPISISKQVVGGTYTIDAGSYLFESNRDELVAKARKLGYEPLVTPIDATLDMTRLRLGTFGKDEVQEVLALARTIEPGSYSAPAGDRYVVYAGTFLQSRNVEKLSQRFVAEGLKVHPEPVQVVRTLSRIRFGRFATEEDAAFAAREATAAGLKAAVVKFK